MASPPTFPPPRAAKKPMAHRSIALRGAPADLARLVSLVIGLGLLASARTALAQSSPEAAAVVRLCATGPDAAVARAVRAEGAAGVDAAGVLPNPSLVLQHQQTVEGPQDRETMVALSVPLGLGGRRFLRQDAAEARRAASDASGDALLVEAAIDAQEVLAAATLDRRRAQVLADHQRALEALDAVLEGLTRGGEAARLDRTRQRVQARLHRSRLEEAEARAAASAELARGWLGVAPEAVDEPSLLAPTAPAAPASTRPPHLVALAAEADASRIDADVARRGWVPELDVYAGYRNVDAGGGIGHGLTFGLTVPLTVFDHGQGDAARARAAEGVTRARLAGEEARIQRAERSAATRLARLLATAGEVRSAEADAAEVARATRELYVAGEAPWTELFAAYQAHEEAQLAWLDRLEAVAAARVALARVRGALLDPALERACLAAARGERP